jgi:ATP-dependent RNA helicase SUPV3L1/SUV3
MCSRRAPSFPSFSTLVMLSSAYRPKGCAVCTFGVAEWLVPSTSTTLYHDPSRRHFNRGSTILRAAPGIQRKKSRSNRDPHHQKDVLHHGSRSVAIDPPGDSNVPFTRIQRTASKPSKSPTTYSVFEDLVLEQFRYTLGDLKWHDPKDQAVLQSWGIQSYEELKSKAHKFRMAISMSFEAAEKDGLRTKDNNPLYYRLRSAFIAGDVRGLRREVQYAFTISTVDLKFSPEELENQRRIADLRYPTEWFPATRAMQRTIHLHVGPTNSGKTYHALQRLEAARTGIYAGPLRLLAHEVYTRFNAKGKPCALVTGEERRFPKDLKVVMNSCTVEMVPLNSKVDVAVIDEIQMIADEDRGWAWTQAFLGVQAKEVHLCGELRTVPLIKELCAEMGEKLEIHEYERLSPLQTSKRHLGSLKNLQKGDAVIVFSRFGIHAMKAEIEKATNKRCAVVYGSLPPETRAQQAEFFNNPDNDYDFLVASDAIGMGLNLAIKRVIFESTAKRNGAGGFEILDNSHIKQIGGRAGRYKTAHDAVQGALADGLEADTDPVAQRLLEMTASKQNVGYVTSIEKFDLKVVQRAMVAEIEPLKQAGIFPPATVINRFASFFPPNTPFSYIVLRLHDLAAISPRYKICRLKEQIDTADAIQGFRLTTNDRLIFMAAPIPMRDPGLFEAAQEMAQCVAEQSGGGLLELKCLNLELLEKDVSFYALRMADHLREVESLHKIVTLYLWLSYRFTGVFRSQALAFHVKSLVEERIDLCLKEAHWDQRHRRWQATQREKLLKMEQEGTEESTEVVDEADQGEESSNIDQEDSGNDDSRRAQTSREPLLLSDQSSEVPKTGGDDAPEAPTESVSLPASEMAGVIERGPLWERSSQQSDISARP